MELRRNLVLRDKPRSLERYLLTEVIYSFFSGSDVYFILYGKTSSPSSRPHSGHFTMPAIQAVWKNAQILPTQPVDWPEGTVLVVEPIAEANPSPPEID